MNFTNYKVSDEDFANNNIQSITENTVVGNAEELKRLFDAPAQEVMADKFNDLIDALNALGADDFNGILPIASTTGLGIIKVGNNLEIDENGTLSTISSLGGGIPIYFSNTDPGHSRTCLWFEISNRTLVE